MTPDELREEVYRLMPPHLRSLTYDQAQRRYHEGRMFGAEEWELYRYCWRNGAARFSNLDIEFDDPNGERLDRYRQIAARLGT